MIKHNIILLAYNEEAGIRNALEGLDGYSVVVVVDGDDNTASIAREMGADVFASKEKRGYGMALRDGLLYSYAAGNDRATVMDVGTCDPQWIETSMRDDIVIRNRTFTGLSRRFIISKIASVCLSIAVGKVVKDATFGYRTYRLDSIVGLLPLLRSNGHATNMELLGLAHKSGLSVGYMPAPYQLDANSQLRSKDFKEALRVIWKIYTHQS